MGDFLQSARSFPAEPSSSCSYFLSPAPFFFSSGRMLRKDKEEAEAIKHAKALEEEKAMYSVRRVGGLGRVGSLPGSCRGRHPRQLLLCGLEQNPVLASSAAGVQAGSGWGDLSFRHTG